MNKLLSCRYNMDTNRVEARFEGGTTLAIDCIAMEDEYGNTPAQRAELDWLLYNKPLEYAQLVLVGRLSTISRLVATTAGWKIDIRWPYTGNRPALCPCGNGKIYTVCGDSAEGPAFLWREAERI